MKFIDKNGRLFEKISLVDVIIVLAILFLIFSFVFSKTSNDVGGMNVGKQQVKYTTEIKVYGMCETEREPFSVGDNIYGNDGALIGKVESIEKKPTVVKVKTMDGVYIDKDSAEHSEYFLKIKGSGTETDKGIFASGTLAVIPSNNIVISSRYFYGNAIVLSVEKMF